MGLGCRTRTRTKRDRKLEGDSMTILGTLALK